MIFPASWEYSALVACHMGPMVLFKKVSAIVTKYYENYKNPHEIIFLSYEQSSRWTFTWRD